MPCFCGRCDKCKDIMCMAFLWAPPFVNIKPLYGVVKKQCQHSWGNLWAGGRPLWLVSGDMLGLIYQSKLNYMRFTDIIRLCKIVLFALLGIPDLALKKLNKSFIGMLKRLQICLCYFWAAADPPTLSMCIGGLMHDYPPAGDQDSDVGL